MSEPTSEAIRNRSAAGSFFRSARSSARQRGDGVSRSATQAALHRKPLLNFNHDPAAGFECVHGAFDDSEAGIRRIGWDARIFAANLNSGAAPDGNANQIAQGNRLIHGAQVMKSVRPQRADAEPEVDLGERWEGNKHDGAI